MGKLKFKSGETVTTKGVVKKKAKKDKEKGNELAVVDDAPASTSQETREGVFLEPPPPEADRRTAAERRYDEQRAATEAKRVTQMMGKSHRERVAEFNTYLQNLSEHYDIPKVGPG